VVVLLADGDPDDHADRDTHAHANAGAMKREGFFSRLVFVVVLGLTSCSPAPSTPGPATAVTPTEGPTPVVSVVTEPAPELATPAPAPSQRFTFPTPGVGPVSAWRPPPYPAPWSIRPSDHFYFTRPIPSGDVNWAHPLYRYGNTYFGEESVHGGVDLGADRDTPVLAVGTGEVVWAGYGLYTGTRDLTDPYGLAIAVRHDFGYQDQTLYTVYGHLSEVYVWVGQRVRAGEEIGLVGDTGHASGPHLHFEIRLGENRYYTTRNPELWMVLPEGWGVLAGRVMDAGGRPLMEHPVVVRSLETGRRWEGWTYAAQSVNGDDVLDENFALADLPAGPYEISILYFRRAYTASLWLRPGQTNLFEFRGWRGYTVEPTPQPADLTRPPVLP
jgi:murein DD-endopeptidase MepM/ murein hydrolase activator NlpD